MCSEANVNDIFQSVSSGLSVPEKHLWRITSAAIAVAMVTGITRCM